MFLDWVEHPVTEALREALAGKRQERKNDWEDGNVLNYSKDEQMLRNAAAIGECNGYRFVQELTFEKLQEELEDDAERERFEAPGPGSPAADVRAAEEKGPDRDP